MTEDKDETSPVRWARDNPVIAFVLAGVLSGSGINGLWNATTNPRPDPWTGTDAKAAEQRSITRDTAEAAARSASDTSILERVRNLEKEVKECAQYRSDHRVESQRGFSLIDQCQRDLERLRKKVER